jgi:hypothetical protein
MPEEKIGDKVTVDTHDHPPRTDSPEYVATRKWLMGETAGGCYICGGPVDLSHPAPPGDPKGMEDHHGGGIFVKGALVGFNLFPLEWSMGWGASPATVQAFVRQLHDAGLLDGDCPVINTVSDVMQWVDGRGNANVKLCLAPDSPVLMADGHQVPIAEVTAGDMVIGHDGQPHRVTGAYSKPWRGDLVVVDGIAMTPEHPVLTPAGWVEALQLGSNSRILRVLGQEVRRVGRIEPQILHAIVGAVPIDMVDRLTRQQSPSKCSLHDVAVFHDQPLLPVLPYAQAAVAGPHDAVQPVRHRAGCAVEDRESGGIAAGSLGTALAARPVVARVARRDQEGLAAYLTRLLDASSDRAFASVSTGWSTVRQIRRVGFHGRVHDISVEGSHSFMSGGFAVHNCQPHHTGHQTSHTPDHNGHEAVGIHFAPWPILAAQATCDWPNWDMWGGTTGTIAVAPHPSGDGTAVVLDVHHSHPDQTLRPGTVLPRTHPHARAARAGVRS